MMQITATFTVFGLKTRELDLTPALGIALLVAVVLLVGHNTMIGG